MEETNFFVRMLIDRIKAYDSVDRTLFWSVIACLGVPQNIFSSFVNSTMACKHACGSTTGCTWRDAAEQALRQGCVLAPLLFNTFFAAVINVAYSRFKVDKDTMDALVHLMKEKGAGRKGGSNFQGTSPGNAALGHVLRWRCRGRLVIPRAAEEDD